MRHVRGSYDANTPGTDTVWGCVPYLFRRGGHGMALNLFEDDKAEASRQAFKDGPPKWLAIKPVKDMSEQERQAELRKIAKRLK